MIQDEEEQSLEPYVNQVYGDIVEMTEEKGIVYMTLSSMLPQAMSSEMGEGGFIDFDSETIPMEMYAWKFMISNDQLGAKKPEIGSKVAIVFYGEPSSDEYVFAEFLTYPEI